MFEAPLGIPEKRILPVVEPESPAFALKQRYLCVLSVTEPVLVSFLPAPTTPLSSKTFIKGAVSRDFRPLFFHESNPSGLKWFFLKIRFRENI